MKKLVILALLVLVACADDDSPNTPKEKSAKPEVFKTDHLICPQTAILEAAQETFDYGGEKSDPSQLVAKARMKSVTGDCGYITKHDDDPTGIDINFTLHMVASRGKRLGGTQASFPYFIAVIDPVDTILSRQTVTAHFQFDGSDKTTVIDEPLHVFIPMAETAMEAGPDYRVLVGFRVPKR
jgi:hypothetical protein